MQSRIF